MRAEVSRAGTTWRAALALSWLCLAMTVPALGSPARARAQEHEARRAADGTDRASAPPGLEDVARVDLESRVPASWSSDVSDGWRLEPASQRRRLPRRCHTRGGFRAHCSGARLVASPGPEAREVAAWLGLGERGTAHAAMHRPALPEWIAYVAGDDPDPHLSFPVPTGHAGRGFGFTRHGELAHRRHLGIDVGAHEGTPIVAARGGLVLYSDNAVTGYGNTVILLHADGATTLYAHCRATHVAAGERVARGQVIAEVGRTGFAQGPHLHFEWRTRGIPRDPHRLVRPRDEADEARLVAAFDASALRTAPAADAPSLDAPDLASGSPGAAFAAHDLALPTARWAALTAPIDARSRFAPTAFAAWPSLPALAPAPAPPARDERARAALLESAALRDPRELDEGDDD